MLSTNTVSNINTKPYSYNPCLSIYIYNYSGEHITPFKGRTQKLYACICTVSIKYTQATRDNSLATT